MVAIFFLLLQFIFLAYVHLFQKADNFQLYFEYLYSNADFVFVAGTK